MTQAIQVSSKLNDGRIFVVGGDNIDAFEANLKAIVGETSASSIMDEMAKSLVGVPNIQTAISNVKEAFPNASVDHTAHPVNANVAPTAKTCMHGTMTKRSGSGAKGPWKGFFCPSPKGTPDQCSPVFIQRNDPMWSTFQ